MQIELIPEKIKLVANEFDAFCLKLFLKVKSNLRDEHKEEY